MGTVLDPLDRMDELFEKSKGGMCAITPKESTDHKDALSVVYAARAVNNSDTLVKIARIAAFHMPHENNRKGRPCAPECPRCQINKLMETLK